MSIRRFAGANANRRGPGAMLAAAMLVVLGACDGDTTQLIEEINAAREGCTEEQLKAADEACVQMFDRYADMGEDAIETYIGGMKALDEALSRRGGLRFDTAGLGDAISDSLLLQPGDADLTGATSEADFFDDATQPYRLDGDAAAADDGGWETTADRDARLGVDGNPFGAAVDPRDRSVVPDRRLPPRGAPSASPAPRRGVLLPPDERLRRPWIGDEPARDPYYGGSDRRAIPPVERPAPADDRGFDPPEEPIPPYPRE